MKNYKKYALRSFAILAVAAASTVSFQDNTKILASSSPGSSSPIQNRSSADTPVDMSIFFGPEAHARYIMPSCKAGCCCVGGRCGALCPFR